MIGMGRSGTSLTARILNLLGADLGPEEGLIGSARQNLKGYWEQRAFYDLNETLLRALGGDYEHPPRLEPGWERAPELAPLKERARALIEEYFGGVSLWGFKDPRASLTLGFWRELVPRMRYVICVRNPVEVSESFARYTTAPDAQQVDWLDLWLLSTASALVQTADSPRLLVFYEDYFSDLRGQVARLAAFIGRSVTPAALAAIQEFADHGLRHHRSDAQTFVEDDAQPAPVRRLYAALRALPPDHRDDDLRAVDDLARDLLAARSRTAGSRAPNAVSALARFPADLATPGVCHFGIYPDGWVERHAYVLMASGDPGDLAIEADVLPNPAQRLDVLVDSRVVASRDAGPGLLRLRAPVPASSSPRRVELRWASASRIAGDDTREAAARLDSIALVPSAGAPHTVERFPADLRSLEFGGIYDDGWLDKHAYAVLGGGGAAVLRFEALAVGRRGGSQHLDVIVDGRCVASRRVEPGDLVLRVPLEASTGNRRIELRWADAVALDPPDRRQAAALLRRLAVVPASAHEPSA